MSSSLSFEQRLVRYYTRYNPDKIPTIPSILKAFKGREVSMFEELVSRYGPEPTDDDDAVPPSTPPRAPSMSQPVAAAPPSGVVVPLPAPYNDGHDELRMRLYRFYNYYNPSNCLNIEKVIVAYHSKQDALFAEITKKYGPEPSHRARFSALFAKYMPDKLGKVDELLAKYQGKEETYIQAIVAKYGPEPILTADQPAVVAPTQEPVRNASMASPTTAPAQPRASASSGAVADRILRMLQIHLPAKVDQLETLLAKYQGREEEYLNALVNKYGPEPAPGPSPAAPQEVVPPVAAPPAPSPSSEAAAPVATNLTVRDRVGRMIQAYLPNKVPQLDQLLEKYKGREEEYLAALIGKYGSEPAPDSTAAPSPALERQMSVTTAPSRAAVSAAPDHRERVLRMFQQYTPAKVGQVDAMLEKYKGREDDYLAALVARHGPEPATSPAATPQALDGSMRSEAPTVDRRASSSSVAPANDIRARVTRMIQQYLPNKVAQVDSLLEKYKGREEEYLTALVSRYGAEPAAMDTADQQQAPSPPALEQTSSNIVASQSSVTVLAVIPDHRERITRMFQQYTPAKIGQVDAMLEKYKGREDDYIAALVTKHGPEPTATQANDTSPRVEGSPTVDRKSSMASPAPAQASAPVLDVRERVARMIRTYLPAKVAQIDAMLEKYKDREEDYLAALVTRYGAEPAAATEPSQQQQQQAVAPPAAEAAVVASPAVTPLKNASDVRSRLQRFYSKYQPDKINNADGILAKYEGREEDLFAALVNKYGPEPEYENAEAPMEEGTVPQPPAQQLSSSTSSRPEPTPVLAAEAAAAQSSSSAFDWLTTVSDDLERDRLEALAKAHGIAAVNDEAVFKLLCSISASLAPIKNALASPAAVTVGGTASPERTALHTRLFADSNADTASPSRAALVTESWREQGRQIAESTRLQIIALEEVEREERRSIEDIDEDEREIICNALSRSQQQTLLKVQLERAVNGNTTSLRRKSFELWQLYAKARQHQRRITQVRDMSMYQRLQMTPLARKYYDTLREQEEKKAEKVRAQKEREALERSERVRKQRLAIQRSGGQDFVSINKSRVVEPDALVPMLDLRTSSFASASATSPQRHALRPPLERMRSPRHSTAVVYIDPKTGSTPATPVSTGRPSLAKIVSMRGGPSPNARADFQGREARLQLIQQQFDLLPPAQKARVFRKLKKWDMVPVLDAQRAKTGSGGVPHQRRARFSSNAEANVHDISNATDATSASLPSHHQMFSPSVATSRHAIPSPIQRGASGGGRTSNPLNSYDYDEDDEEAPSHNVSHDALDMERVRMENSRADKLFNSPFVEDVKGETGGSLHHGASAAGGSIGGGAASMMMGARYLRSPQTPMSVSYIHEPSPMTPSAHGNTMEDDEAVRSVVERLTFQSAVKNFHTYTSTSVPSSSSAMNRQRTQRPPVEEDGGEEYPPDDEDLHAYMLETLRDAMRGSQPRSA
jgi:hypothetical protein